MPEIARAILLPPSQLPQRASARAVQGESGSASEAARDRRAPEAAHGVLTLIDPRREDTVEVRGKQFRFRPYNSRGAAEAGLRETGPAPDASEAEAISREAESERISSDVFDGFGAGPQPRNASAFIASLIAQERPRQGLYNPQFEAASDAYRRAGGSPPAVDNQPRVFSIAV